MRRLWITLVGLGLIAAIGLGMPAFSSIAQTGSPEASPFGSPAASPIGSSVASPAPSATPTQQVPDLEGTVHALQVTVAAQVGRIAVLQTQVAELAIPVETPESDTDVTAESQDLAVVILLRARADEIEGSDLGDECSGTGRWADLGPDTEITIADVDENVLATGELVSSEIVFSGQLFKECELTFTLAGVPAMDEYIFEIPGRSRMTLSADELDVVNWTLELSFGP